MLLIHGGVGAVQHIVDELLSIRQRNVLAVDIMRTFLIHLEKMAAEISSCDVDILANFEVSVGAQHKESSVSPGSETIGRKPVHANVTCPVVPSQHYIAKIFQARVLRVVQVADL